jgi:hypothetical protein
MAKPGFRGSMKACSIQSSAEEDVELRVLRAVARGISDVELWLCERSPEGLVRLSRISPQLSTSWVTGLTAVANYWRNTRIQLTHLSHHADHSA